LFLAYGFPSRRSDPVSIFDYTCDPNTNVIFKRKKRSLLGWWYLGTLFRAALRSFYMNPSCRRYPASLKTVTPRFESLQETKALLELPFLSAYESLLTAFGRSSKSFPTGSRSSALVSLSYTFPPPFLVWISMRMAPSFFAHFMAFPPPFAVSFVDVSSPDAAQACFSRTRLSPWSKVLPLV